MPQDTPKSLFARRSLALGIAALASGMGACSSEQPPTPVITPGDTAFRAGRTGLELRTIFTVGTDATIANAGPPAGTESVAAMLSRAGIRVVELSLEEATSFAKRASEASPISGLSSAWINPGLSYSEALRDSGSTQTRSVALDDSIVRAPPGATRVLARCWVEPVTLSGPDGSPTIGSLMRLQLVPQLFEAASGKIARPAFGSSPEPARDTPKILEETERGLLLSRLFLEAKLAPDRVLVLTFDGADPPPPEPEIDPNRSGRQPGEVSRATDEPEVYPGGAARPNESLSPPRPVVPGPVFRTPLIGELLFTSIAPGSLITGRPVYLRRVVLFFPRMQERFGILP